MCVKIQCQRDKTWVLYLLSVGLSKVIGIKYYVGMTVMPLAGFLFSLLCVVNGMNDTQSYELS